ncbi:hypothetical protein H6G06_25455 [Anabaena sphaerica FACHB-251]|uniref:Uncharacterized protein n=1 Tax=Anabaena sphaerica FACHB-251 TaxID=2692883 RepID=A0A927A3Q9_9NOST|nr:hypothetical protein [Anabaena sphaerica]MBD2296738.1 hypothetical protein [Anabaena sphaerica FACHB-251]
MDSYIIGDHPFGSQQLPLKDFDERGRGTGGKDALLDTPSREPFSLENPEMPTSLKQKLALIQPKSAIKTLFIVSKSPSPLLASEISEATGLHRGTISGHAKDIAEIGLFHCSYVPGTEKKHKPTLMYSLSPDVDKAELFEILSFIDPSLFEATPEQSFSPEFTAQSDEEVEHPHSKLSVNETDLTESNEAGTSTLSTDNQSFEQQISFILTQMAEEIVSLQNRVTELEQKTTQRVEERKQVDLSQALTILNSKKSGK